MKNINLIFLLLILCLTACQKNQDIIVTDSQFPPPELVPTTDISWSALVGEHGSVWNWSQDIGKLHNVSIQLMYDGVVLDETNTNESGEFSFPTQPVPDEGAYFLFESPGYYNNVINVDTFLNSISRVNMMRNTFPNINGDAINTGGPYITLKGKLQDPTEASFLWYYITNVNNELIGTTTSTDGASFTITTLADEELFLHYNMACYPEGIIPLGSYSQESYLGVLLDQSFDFINPYDCINLTNVYDCSGNDISEYRIFYKMDGLTTFRQSSTSTCRDECELLAHPIIATITTQNPRKYQEKTITYSSGQNLTYEVTVCEDDDTFIKYTIGNGSELTSDLFTFSNILPDDRLLLKQTSTSFGSGTSIAFVISGSTVGSNTSNVTFSIGNDNTLGGYELNSSITMNDGAFVEGTFSGEVFDAYEVSLGILEGSFRARIQ